MTTNATYNSIEVVESPMDKIEGGTYAFTVTYPDTVTTGGGWMYAYKGSTDVSSTVLTGSLSASGSVLTLKTISGLIGGNEYRFVWCVTCQGQSEPYSLLIRVHRKNGR